MEGSAAYARSGLKSDLRNTRTLLGVLSEGEDDEDDDLEDAEVIRQLEQLVHDVTVGLREGGAEVDIAALRRFVEAEAAERRIADDTLRQWARSLERMLPWWTTLPPTETLLAAERWPEVDLIPDTRRVLEIQVTADERFRVLLVARTRDTVRACFEKYVSKHPAIVALRLLDGDGEPVATLVSDPAGAHWVG